MERNEYLTRVISLVLYVLGLGFLFSLTGHSVLSGSSIDLLLFSSLVVLAINLCIVEYFFETPRDVIGASLNGMLLLLSLYNHSSFSSTLFWVLFGYYVIELGMSVGAVVLWRKEDNPDSILNRISGLLKKISIHTGKSKVIFSTLILFLLVEFYKNEDIFFYASVAMYWILLSLEDFRKGLFSCITFIVSFFKKKMEEKIKPIGTVSAIQSKDTFIIDLFDVDKREELLPFDFIEFQYQTDKKQAIVKCFIIDRYFLNSQQKIKVLRIEEIKITNKNKEQYKNYEKKVVYKILNPTGEDKERVENFVGTVVDRSNISQIRFEYSSKKLLTDGDLLEIEAKNKQNESVKILYQVTEAITDIKTFEDKNEIGLIIANAVQLGVWQTENRNFENYGWVPRINSPVYTADKVEGPKQNKQEVKLGTIEDTNFNVLANINDLVTHHTAILGTTGSGKSVFARKLIKELATAGNKIFCVDLTGEAKRFLSTRELIATLEQITIQGLPLKI